MVCAMPYTSLHPQVNIKLLSIYNLTNIHVSYIKHHHLSIIITITMNFFIFHFADSHISYAVKCIEAGIKYLYIEKPVGLNAIEAQHFLDFITNKNKEKEEEDQEVKCVVAHYRRSLPQFKRIKQMIADDMIGRVRLVNIRVMQNKMKSMSSDDWRIDPTMSGGGLFHDLSPHQLDILIDLFGEVESSRGYSSSYFSSSIGTGDNKPGDNNKSAAPDSVCGQILFKSGVIANGQWFFSAPNSVNGEDLCEIIGSNGVIRFGFFGRIGKVTCSVDGIEDDVVEVFESPPHIQQPMIEELMEYFTNDDEEKGAEEMAVAATAAKNPCSVQEAVGVMQVIDSFV